jgi:hypothetical protein
MTIPLEQRFWSHVVVADTVDECWRWTGAIDRVTGYGRIGRGRRADGTASAHRVAYEIQIGPIPAGLTIDHTCLNRACVNARHLEPVTLEENVRRAKRRWTHCVHGHEFTPENTYWRKEGRRNCRQCRRDRRAVA